MSKVRIANAIKKKIKDMELKLVDKEAEILKQCTISDKMPRDQRLKLKLNIIQDFIPSCIRERIFPWYPENAETCNLANEQQPVKTGPELANEVYQSDIEEQVYSSAWKPIFKENENE